MSEVQQPVAPVAEPIVADPVATTAETAAIEPLAPTTETAAVTEAAPVTDTPAPAVNGTVEEPEAVAAPVVEPVKAEESTPAATTADKVVEPVTEGQLAYKGPGLVSSLIPSKKEFWLNDAAVTREHLDLYLRGEKAEISHPVAAWASQTGKGLLFYNKKGDLNHEHPSSILALYDVVDLKKAYPHEIVFKLNGHQHTLKAASDTERDGWYVSLEKAIELGKAQKEAIIESPTYKSELETLAKPTISTPIVNGAAATGSVVAAGVVAEEHSKSSEVATDDATTPAASDVKNGSAKKSRSTSRGVFNRLLAKKDELETKKEEKVEKEAEPSSEVAPVVIAGGSTLDAHSTADRAVAAPVEETAAETDAAKVDEKPKPSKRNSIFGKLQGGWAAVTSPTKEKSEKDAELKPEVPSKDAGVSETAPQIPEPSTTEAVTEVAPPVVEETIEPATTESAPAEVTKDEPVSPSTHKSGFLSGLFPKRGRSVSPSTPLTDAKKEETPVVEATPAAEPAVVVAPVEEPVAPVVATDTSAVTDADKSEPTSPANKRQSVLGSLGRRASKALNRMQAPKKENVAPATTEVAPEEAVASEATPAAEAPVVDAETKTTETVPQSIIGDVVPEAVHVGQPQAPVVTASA